MKEKLSTIPVPEMAGIDMAFGKVDHLPPMTEIPEEFKNFNRETKWNELVSRWFYSGLPKETEFIAKDGVDPKKALRAIGAILASWDPEHEHKMAGAAYLMSEWFKEVKVPK